ncbi:OLC1v1006359C1 [Oldenlandia corymbosa var. corymbosa]|uniref:OLC1v1006359C1 n=1 Tax=Oldenlandia corymbosa var. corymbosa TaxID=529605 RepID=A0AAV1DGS4_OLDCO|nr:OLC1v1006359C1 [Oldenlandia corymbosa var. corymbosa]
MWRGEDYIRPDDEVSEILKYGEGSSFVTVKIHHSGGFVTNKTGKLVFFQVEVDYFDEVKSEDLKLEEVNSFIDRIGFCRPHKLFYVDPNVAEFDGFRRLNSDQDLKSLMEFTSAEKGKVVVIYRIGVNEYDPLPGPKPKRPAYLDVGEESDADDEDYEPESDYSLSDSDDESSCKYANESMRTSYWASLRKPSEFVPYAHVPETGDSEYDQASCDELHEVKGSDDEEDQVEVKRYREFNPKKEMHNPTFEVTQRFGDKWILLKAIRIHALVERRGTHFKKNDTKVVHARCVEGCNWEVYGARVSKEDPTFEIRTLNDKHTCDKIWEKNRNCNSNIVSDWYLADFAHDLRMSVGTLQFRVLNEKKITISRTQAYNVNIKALEKVRGNIVEQYAKLEGYMEETKKLNPGTTFELMKDPNPERPDTFKRACCQLLSPNFQQFHTAKSSYVKEHEELMAALKDYDEATWRWLDDLNFANWCRELPILGMLEWLRVYLTKRGQKKREWLARNEFVVGPKIKRSKFWKKHDGPQLQPPEFKHKIGRHKGSRNKDKDEPVRRNKRESIKASRKTGKGVNKCSKCNVTGHIRRHCPDLLNQSNQVAQQGQGTVADTNPPIPKRKGRPPKKNPHNLVDEDISQVRISFKGLFGHIIPVREGDTNNPQPAQQKRRGRPPTTHSKCKQCKQMGHTKSICPELARKRSKEAVGVDIFEQNTSVVQCDHCRLLNHTIVDCPVHDAENWLHDNEVLEEVELASTLRPSSSADPATPFIVQNHDVAEPNNTDDSLSSNQQQHQIMDQLEQDSNQTPSADERSPEPEATITNVTLSANLDDHEADIVILPTVVTSMAANKAIKNRKKSAHSTPKRKSARLAAVKVRFDVDGHGSSPEKAIQILGKEAVETSVGRKRAKTFHGANPHKSTLFTHCI